MWVATSWVIELLALKSMMLLFGEGETCIIQMKWRGRWYFTKPCRKIFSNLFSTWEKCASLNCGNFCRTTHKLVTHKNEIFLDKRKTFLERYIRASEFVSNLSRRYVFMEHSLHCKNFYHRTPKNSKYSLQMLGGYDVFVLLFILLCDTSFFVRWFSYWK